MSYKMSLSIKWVQVNEKCCSGNSSFIIYVTGIGGRMVRFPYTCIDTYHTILSVLFCKQYIYYPCDWVKTYQKNVI